MEATIFNASESSPSLGGLRGDALHSPTFVLLSHLDIVVILISVPRYVYLTILLSRDECTSRKAGNNPDTFVVCSGSD